MDEACLDHVRAYQSTEAYTKALRKRQVWVDPLFAEARILARDEALPFATALARQR